jgi:hypothetical protein
MPKLLAHTEIARPASLWCDGEVLPLRVNLPARVAPLLGWLSDRWAVPVAGIASDILIAATSGRFLLAQLTGHNLQPDQDAQGAHSTLLSLNLPKPSVALLDKALVPDALDLGQKGCQLVSDHLFGILNPQAVSVALPDPDGEKLRADDSSLTVHLPAELEDKIEKLANYHELTKSDVIRNCLLLHVYGRIRYELWTSEGSWRPKRKALKQEVQAYMEGDARFSRVRPYRGGNGGSTSTLSPRGEFIRQHGKSGDGTRVFMPALLRLRLDDLAASQRLRVSEYCRRTLAALI